MSKTWKLLSVIAILAFAFSLIAAAPMTPATVINHGCKPGETFNDGKCLPPPPKCQYGEDHGGKCLPPPVVIVPVIPAGNPHPMRCSTRFYPGGKLTAGYWKWYGNHCAAVEDGGGHKWAPGEKARPWFNK